MSDFFVASTDKNCLSYWFPKIVDHVPTPATFFVKISDGMRLANLLDGESCWFFDGLCEVLRGAAKIVGTPCFLRTGQGAGKHDWNRCCCVDDLDKIGQHVFNLVDWSNMVNIIGLPHDVWVIRKMLPVRPVFRCVHYGNMPVVHEWRYFVDGEKLLYGIPYWPEGALKNGEPDIQNWKEHLAELHTEPEGGRSLAMKAGGAVGGKWSVDVLVCEDGLYVTDMATAERSFGWDVIRGEENGDREVDTEADRADN